MRLLFVARRAAVAVVVGLIGLYRLVLSPLLGPACRFEPSCSRYAEEAVRRFGIWGGLARTARRLARCHPWGGWGWDPVSESGDACGAPRLPQERTRPA